MTDEKTSLLRIEKLETENPRIKWGLGLCIILFTLSTLLMVTERVKTKSTLEAKEFLLRDQAGRVAARLGSSSRGTCFELLGRTKEASALMCAGDESGSDLLLTTRHGESRAFLSADGRMYETVDGTILPGLFIAENGAGIISATVGTKGKLAFGPGTGQNAVVISVPQTKPTIDLLANDGKTLWNAP